MSTDLGTSGTPLRFWVHLLDEQIDGGGAHLPGLLVDAGEIAAPGGPVEMHAGDVGGDAQAGFFQPRKDGM